MDALARLLVDYRRDVAADQDYVETVEVRVERSQGFQNTAMPASGHEIEVDEPETFGGAGRAADPAELLLAAIGSSLSVTLTAHAALEEIPISSIAIRLEGWMSPQAFLEPGSAPSGGVNGLHLTVTIHSAADAGRLRRLLDRAVAASPVVQSLRELPAVDLVYEHAA